MKFILKINLYMTVLILSLMFFSCDRLSPTQNESQKDLATEGIPLDQVNLLEWSPEVIQSIRFVPDEEESVKLARRGWSTAIPGIDVEKVRDNRSAFIGGDITFGNSVYIPAGSVDDDKYIAVQMVCADADELATMENSSAYISTIKTALSTLVADLTNNSNDDENNYLALYMAASALEDVEESEVFFQLYSFYASDRAFSKLEANVVRRMRFLMEMIEEEALDASYHTQLQTIASISAETARELANTQIIYAQSFEDANTDKILQAIDRLEEGDEYYTTPDDEYELEWYNYASALRKYFYAWKKATQAIRNMEAPCGALVDFLPSQQFQGDVIVTLSWEALNFNGDVESLEIYWYNEATELWVYVPDPVIDHVNGTVSVHIDHFTRYAWGTTEPVTTD